MENQTLTVGKTGELLTGTPKNHRNLPSIQRIFKQMPEHFLLPL